MIHGGHSAEWVSNGGKEPDEVVSTVDVIEEFHRWSYNVAPTGKSWGGLKYFNLQMWKWPGDLLLYQEVVVETKPALIIETGTHAGASALFFAHLLDQLSYGRVVSIDIKPWSSTLPKHPRIDYITKKSSVAPDVLVAVKRMANESDGPVMVVLDSDHAQAHVEKELAGYAPLVTSGSYLIVEDTNVNGHPVYPQHGPGPMEAVDAWLPSQKDNWKEDTVREEKFGFSYHRWFQRRKS